MQWFGVCPNALKNGRFPRTWTSEFAASSHKFCRRLATLPALCEVVWIVASTTGSSLGHFSHRESGIPYFSARSTCSLFFSLVLNAASIKAAASSDISTSFAPALPQMSTSGSSSSAGSSSLSLPSEAVFLLLLGRGIAGYYVAVLRTGRVCTTVCGPVLQRLYIGLHDTDATVHISYDLLPSPGPWVGRTFSRVDCQIQIKMPMKLDRGAIL